MYPCRLLVIGKPKLQSIRELETHYRTLLKGYLRLEVTELTEGKGEGERQLLEEAEKLLPLLMQASSPILLSAEGPCRSSEAFAAWLGAKMDRGETLVFAIGSSHGFHPNLKREVKEMVSLSPMTFPHDLSRILLLEQLYRGFAILRGKTYHK